MAGIMGSGGLPPGLAGYVQGQEFGNRQTAHNIGALGSGLGILQGMRQMQFEDMMKPLQFQQLQQTVAKQAQLQELMQTFMARTGQGQMQAGQQSMAEGARVGDIGPTVTNAARANAVPSGLGYAPADLVPLNLAGKDTTDLLKIWEAQNPTAQIHNGYAFNPRLLQHGQALPGMQVTPQGQAVQTTIGPGGLPQISPMAGSLDTFRAFEGVKAGFDLVDVPDGRGGTIKMPKSQAITALGGLPQLGGGGLPALRTSAPNDAEALRIAQEADNRGQPVSVTAPGQPGAGGGLGLGRTLPAADAAGASATATARAKGGVDFEQSVLDGGRAARSNLTNLQIVAPNLDKLPTGPMYPMLLNLNNYMQQLGIKVDQNLGPAQATDAVLKQFALRLRDPAGGGGMPGALSDADREFLVNMLPGLTKAPDGNRQLIKVLTAIEQRKINEASIVNKMQAAKYGSNDIRDALSQYSSQNSIQSALR